MDSKAPAKQSTSGASTQAKPPKLKDTCTACASSKLRCSRDKPVCKRCELRGLSCHYDTSKRSGRTSQATKAAQERRQREEEDERLREEQRNQCQPPPNTPLQMRSNPTFASSQAPAPVAPMIPMPETALSPLSLPTTLAPEQDAFAWIESLNQDDMNSWNEAWNANQQDFEPSLPLPLPNQDSNITGIAFDNTALPDFTSQIRVDHNAVPAIAAAPKMSRSVTMPLSANLTATSASSDSLSSYTDKWNHISSPSSSVVEISFDELISKSNISPASCTSSPEPPNCCLSVAVGFLVQVAPNSKTLCTMSGNEQGSNPIQENNTTIEDNRLIVDELVKILECRCSQDGYLLTIISLVLFKTMSRYASIVEQSSSRQRMLTTTDGVTSNHRSLGHRRAFSQHDIHIASAEDPALRRSAVARIVLSQLHRVQRLVNLLSQKMEDVREQGYNSSGSSGSSSRSSRLSDCSAGAATASSIVVPMSSASFTQLESDLRECLGQISCDMIDILRSDN